MGVYASEIEFPSPVSPEKLYKALSVDAKNFLPKALPNFIKDIEILEGDGSPGTIEKFTLAEGSMKHKIDVNDIQNYVHQYTLFEGGFLTDKLERIVNHYKFVATPNGGTILKSTHTYYTKNDEHLSEDYLQAGKQQTLGFLKAVEDYLVANPDHN